MSFVFKKTYELNGDFSEITYKSNSQDLTSIIEEFQCFLKGCGFHFNGELEIVENQEELVSDDPEKWDF